VQKAYHEGSEEARVIAELEDSRVFEEVNHAVLGRDSTGHTNAGRTATSETREEDCTCSSLVGLDNASCARGRTRESIRMGSTGNERNGEMNTTWQYPWKEAADRVVEVNDANGFDRPTMENLPIKLMLVVTELEEARQATTGETTDPLNEELADVAVRLLHILQSMWPNDWHLRVQDWHYRNTIPRTNPFGQIEVLLWPILAQCCDAVESWRKKYEPDMQINVEYALAETLKLSRRLGYDLLEEIKTKVEKNAKRGHLHGKARPEG
jgi:NTP pyrophosphatase (non-canonical NTP hydrolase)